MTNYAILTPGASVCVGDCILLGFWSFVQQNMASAQDIYCSTCDKEESKTLLSIDY